MSDNNLPGVYNRYITYSSSSSSDAPDYYTDLLNRINEILSWQADIDYRFEDLYDMVSKFSESEIDNTINTKVTNAINELINDLNGELDRKLEKPNIKAGTNISLTKDANSNDITINDTINLNGYATKTYVSDEIAKAGTGGNVDLTGYAKTTDLNAHTSDTNIHITTAERNKWNAIDNKIEALNTSQYLKYGGESVICNNTLASRTSDMIIKGKTYPNLIIGKKSSSNINYENGVITSQITPSADMSPVIQLNLLNVIANRKYTFLCNVIENTNNTLLIAGGTNDQHEIMNKTELKMGINKIVFTSKSTLTDNITLPIWFRAPANVQQSVKIKDLILLDGDWKNKEVPSLIAGIESAGEKENKIIILSKNNESADDVNYREDKKEILLPIEGGLKSLPNGAADTIEQRADGVYLVQRVKKIPLYGSVGFGYPQEQNSENTVLIYFTNTRDGMPNAKNILCNAINSYNGTGNIWDSSFNKEGIVSNQKADILIRINKSRLNTVDNNGIQKFINDNQLTVYYEFKTPVERKLDIQNLDLEVYEDITYVTTDNAIHPTLSFKVPSNIGNVIKELNDKIEKNENQYCYTHGCKFEVEKHLNFFNLNSLKPGNNFTTIYWPWIIRVDDKLDNPLGKYYLYYSTDHAMNNGGIGLAYSDNILDGFTDYGKIYQNGNKETETPSVIYDYKNKKFIIYFHSLASYEGEHQSSWRILSDDGINFDSSTLKKAFDLNHNELMGDLHNGYLHPFNIGDTWYAYSLMGGGDNPTSAFHISEDGGYTWKTDYKQMASWGYKPENDTLLNPYHGTVIQKYGIFWWIGARTNFTSGSNPKKISSIDIVPLNDFTHPAAKSSVLISMDNEVYESNNIRQCTCFYDEGNIYILYQCDNIFNLAILK